MNKNDKNEVIYTVFRCIRVIIEEIWGINLVKI